MSENDQCEMAKPSFTVTVALTPLAVESMRCMFLHGPTWDGNIPSKSGRDELFDLKLATRIQGYSWLTADGIRLALSNGMDREKERWERLRRQQAVKLDEIERILSPEQTVDCQQSNVMGLSRAPTVEGLERLLKPEPTPTR